MSVWSMVLKVLSIQFRLNGQPHANACSSLVTLDWCSSRKACNCCAFPTCRPWVDATVGLVLACPPCTGKKFTHVSQEVVCKLKKFKWKI